VREVPGYSLPILILILIPAPRYRATPRLARTPAVRWGDIVSSPFKINFREGERPREP